MHAVRRLSQCNQRARAPALCLVCGAVVGGSERGGGAAPACRQHAQRCGYGQGVFLLLAEATVLLVQVRPMLA